MRNLCLGILVALVFFGAVQPCFAEEVSGKLERVDWDSVTIISSDNQRVVVLVDQDHRMQAAPFLGKWVCVDFQAGKGQPRAIRFRSSQ